jgi:diguanylate cyclase (GGDEF)-like protein/PAS domain S-box-containing protein
MKNPNHTDITRLLLVEQSPGERAGWRRVLDQSGHPFAIVEAESTDEGLRLARREPFDCILLDHGLPNCNALEFLSDLGEQGERPDAPVVMLTPANDASAAVRALKLGAAEIVVKDSMPASADRMPALILRLLRERRIAREHRQTEERLRVVEAKYRNLVEHLPVITYTASLEEPGRLLSISRQIERLGRPLEAWLQSVDGLLKFVHTADRERVVEELSRAYGNLESFHCEYRLLDRRGRAHWFVDRASVVRGDDGQPLFLQGTLAESTEHAGRVVRSSTSRKPKGLSLVRPSRAAALAAGLAPVPAAVPAGHAEDGRYLRLLESVGEGFVELDAEGRCTFANRAAVALFGYGPEGLEGRNLEALLAWHRLSDNSRTGTDDEMGALKLTLRRGRPRRFVETLVRRDGHVFAAEFSVHPIAGAAETGGAVVLIRDVSEARALAQRLSYEASHDSLTGLLNRAEFERRLAKVIAAARRNATEHTLCFLDLDRFKAINDRCGHAAGDQVLQSLASLLQGRLRQSDILARLGGDEFGLLLESCSIRQAMGIVSELQEATRGFRFPWAGEEFSVGLSIGMVALHAGSRDVAAVLSAADSACYAAKRGGRDRIHLFETLRTQPAAPESAARLPVASGSDALPIPHNRALCAEC